MTFKTGRIYHLDCKITNPPKNKFCICVAISDDLFFTINSKKWSYQKDENICEIRAVELEFLNHNSFIDVSRGITLSSGTYSDVKENGKLSPDLRLKIRKKVKNSNSISPRHQKIILDNL